MPKDQKPEEGAQSLDQNTRQEQESRSPSPRICGQQNVRANARGNTGQNTDKGHTPSPRIEIKGHWERVILNFETYILIVTIVSYSQEEDSLRFFLLLKLFVVEFRY